MVGKEGKCSDAEAHEKNGELQNYGTVLFSTLVLTGTISVPMTEVTRGHTCTQQDHKENELKY